MVTYWPLNYIEPLKTKRYKQIKYHPGHSAQSPQADQDQFSASENTILSRDLLSF